MKNVGTSCACLSVRVGDGADATERVPPGGSIPFELTLNPAGMEGPITKYAYITFDDGTTETLTVSVNVRTRLALDRADAAFGVVDASVGGKSLALRLKGELAAERKILSVEGPKMPFFSVTKASDARGVTVALPANLTPGLHTETWTVRTDDEEIPEIKLPVSVTVSSDIAVSPSVLVIAKDEGVCSRFVTLRPTEKQPLKVLSAETKPRKWGDVKVESRPLNGWRIVIDNIDPNEVRQFSRRPFIEIKTDLPDLPTLEIPLRVDGSARSVSYCVTNHDGVQQESGILCQYGDIKSCCDVAVRDDLCYTVLSKEKQP